MRVYTYVYIYICIYIYIYIYIHIYLYLYLIARRRVLQDVQLRVADLGDARGEVQVLEDVALTAWSSIV